MLKYSLIILISLINYSFACTGCIDLDNLNFDKIITKFKTSLVKFDVGFPYGEKHEKYAEFSQQIGNKTLNDFDHSNVLIATVSVKDYGDDENKKLAERFGIKIDKLPVIKLFIDGDLSNPIDFPDIGSDTFSLTQLFAFMKEHSKVPILAPGCDEKLDRLSNSFMKNDKKRGKILKEAETAVEEIKCEEKKQIFKFYPAIMKNVIEKGDDFIAAQQERLTKLLKDKISKKKQEEINKKLNILSSFGTKKGSTIKSEL